MMNSSISMRFARASRVAFSISSFVARSRLREIKYDSVSVKYSKVACRLRNSWRLSCSAPAPDVTDAPPRPLVVDGLSSNSKNTNGYDHRRNSRSRSSSSKACTMNSTAGYDLK